MERNEVSIHQVLVFRALSTDRWRTSREVGELLAGKVGDRTVRAHLLALVRLGLVEQAEVFPGHRYRLAEKAKQRNGGYLARLERAAEVFGIAS